MDKIIKLIKKIINERDVIEEVKLYNDDEISFNFKKGYFELAGNWSSDHGHMIYYLRFYPGGDSSNAPVIYNNLQSSLADYELLFAELYTVLREIGTGADKEIERMLKE